MSKNTKIEWCNCTWNPIVMQCSKCSPGCNNCYALKMFDRLGKMGVRGYKEVYDGTVASVVIESELEKPLHWKTPQIVFVGSMCDFFHTVISTAERDRVFSIMEDPRCSKHTFLLLTKRPVNMFSDSGRYGPGAFPKNVWYGMTVCDQYEAEAKLPFLYRIPAEHKFVSIEPMLGSIDLTKEITLKNNLEERTFRLIDCVDWVICGGENGNNARAMHPDWVESLLSQCIKEDKPFFFKGWGEWGSRRHILPSNIPANGMAVFFDKNTKMFKVGKKLSGRLIYGEPYLYFPETIKTI